MLLNKQNEILFFIVHQINERHSLLARTIGSHPLENYSHEMANYLNKVISISVTSFLLLEMIFYNIYATKVLLARWLALGGELYCTAL